jgi:hypothetical protein
MKVPNYQVGDLIVLKQNLWNDNIKRIGIITEMMFKNSLKETDVSFLVMFSNTHNLIKNRIIWHVDVQEHYPVVK